MDTNYAPDYPAFKSIATADEHGEVGLAVTIWSLLGIILDAVSIFHPG